MWLSRIIIKNFRNFRSLDVKLGKHAVVLGENKVGETNLLFALRLILDPSLSDLTRRLRLDDFWDGCTLTAGTTRSGPHPCVGPRSCYSCPNFPSAGYTAGTREKAAF
jgi:predicted ATP-dependent endonuclease of OLD family